MASFCEGPSARMSPFGEMMRDVPASGSFWLGFSLTAFTAAI